jgi:hypothetical protein
VQCACDSEEREHGVGAGVNATMLSETLKVVGLAEAARRPFWLRKKPMNLCACDSEEREHGVGASVNATMLSETLEVVGIAEAAGRPFWLRKKPMSLCV